MLKVIWISKGSIRIPVFVPKKLLDEKDSKKKESEALVLICGQIQPYEDSSEIIDCDGILKMAEGLNKENENTCNS